MKEIPVSVGKTYAVTTAGSCTVTDADGRELCTAESGSQSYFTANGHAVTLSDDAATVTQVNFKQALAAAGLLGGGTDKLPAGYARVDFLESTGTQWVDTGIVPTASTGLLLDNQITTQDDTIPFGCRNSTTTDTRFYACRSPRWSSGVLMLGFGWGPWTSVVSPVPAYSRVQTKLNWLQSGTMEAVGLKLNLSPLLFTPTHPLYLFAANLGGSVGLKFKGRIWSAGVTEASQLVSLFVPALDSAGEPCMFDLVRKQPFENSGTGQFIAGLKDSAQLRTVLRKLPATGGSLKLSLPAEANTPEVAEALQACYDTKGWTITVHEYRPAAAATYSLRRVREVVWCRREQFDLGSYVDATGTRWQIDRCAAIFGALGQDPAAYCYTPFDSVEQAVEFWELAPWVAPNAEPETEPETLT